MLRLSTNWASSLSLTSASAPRPNWATFPEIVRSVCTLQRVDVADSADSDAVMIAEALPLPPVSRPSPFNAAVYVASLRSMNDACPLN